MFMLLVGVVLMLAGLTIRGPASNVSTQIHEIRFDFGSGLILLGALFVVVSVLTYIVRWTIGDV